MTDKYYKDSNVKKKGGEYDYSTSSLDKKKEKAKKLGDGTARKAAEGIISNREKLQKIMNSM